jgi:hypothetical protein
MMDEELLSVARTSKPEMIRVGTMADALAEWVRQIGFSGQGQLVFPNAPYPTFAAGTSSYKGAIKLGQASAERLLESTAEYQAPNSAGRWSS